MKDFKRKGNSSLVEHLKAHCKFPLIETFLESLTGSSKKVKHNFSQGAHVYAACSGSFSLVNRLINFSFP